jgi:putative transposase
MSIQPRNLKQASPGQQSLWDEWEQPVDEIRRVAEKFVLANCFDPKIASIQFEEKNNS